MSEGIVLIMKGDINMRKRVLLISSIVVLGLVGLTACGKKGASSSEATTTEATTTENTEDVSTVATEDKTEATTAKATTEATTASKKDESEKAKSASGVYNGFGDDNSIEIKLDNGKYQTFIVADEKVANKLNDMAIGTKISFTYGALSGQANSQILSVKAK
jgi:hypothetical protein